MLKRLKVNGAPAGPFSFIFSNVLFDNVLWVSYLKYPFFKKNVRKETGSRMKEGKKEKKIHRGKGWRGGGCIMGVFCGNQNYVLCPQTIRRGGRGLRSSYQKKKNPPYFFCARGTPSFFCFFFPLLPPFSAESVMSFTHPTVLRKNTTILLITNRGNSCAEYGPNVCVCVWKRQRHQEGRVRERYMMVLPGGYAFHKFSQNVTSFHKFSQHENRYKIVKAGEKW